MRKGYRKDSFRHSYCNCGHFATEAHFSGNGLFTTGSEDSCGISGPFIFKQHLPNIRNVCYITFARVFRRATSTDIFAKNIPQMNECGDKTVVTLTDLSARCGRILTDGRPVCRQLNLNLNWQWTWILGGEISTYANTVSILSEIWHTGYRNRAKYILLKWIVYVIL